MTALVERIGFEVDTIDVFCGFGGSSQGMKASGATVRCAANHNEINLECHSTNFPETDHWLADLSDASNPEVINRAGKKVAGRYLDPADLPAARYAWFSPACTHHSQANSKKVYDEGLHSAMAADDDWGDQHYVNSERSRVTMSCVLRYVSSKRPEIVAVENVVEVTKWGPNKNGTTFKWWLRELTNLGYVPRLCFFNSMFFGPCPQSRDRIYIVAHRKGNRAPDLAHRPTAFCTSEQCGGLIVAAVQTWKKRKATWMFDTWGKYLQQYDYRCPDCLATVHPASWMALSAIDFTDLGPTLEERIAGGKRPADTTWERIRRAVQKYRYAPPVILPTETVGAHQVPVAHADTISTSNTGSPQRYVGNRSRSVAENLPTLAQRNTIGLAVDGVVVPIQSGPRLRSDSLADPLATLTAGGLHLALALTVKNNGAMDEAGYRGHHAGEGLGSVTAHPTQSVVAVMVPNRTNNAPKHAGDALPPVMTSATEAVVLAAGNTSEHPNQTRARSIGAQLFTQGATGEFAVASVSLRGSHFQDAHGAEHLGTHSTGRNLAIVTALFAKLNGSKASDTSWHGIDEHLGAVTAGNTQGIVFVPWIEQWESDPIHVTEQLATITARMRHTLASIEPSDEPVTDEQLMNVRFRMLQPDPELRRAMAFNDDYILIGNKGQMTAGLGNAVTPPVASWITERCLATLRGSR